MKKFLLKILLYAAIVLGIVFLINLRWINTQAYLLVDEKYKTLNPPSAINVCNVGTSHGMTNFTYESLPEGYSGFNFGRPLQTYFYDLQMLKQNKSKLEDGCVVFVPVSYFSFYQRYDDESILANEYVYYNFLSPWYIKDFSLQMAVEYKWFPILDIHDDQWQYLLHDNANAIEEYDEIFSQNRLIDETTGLIDEERLLAERDKTVAEHVKYFSDGVCEENVQALKNLLDYCDKRGYECILITTPFSDIYNSAEEFDDGFFEEFYGLINEITGEYDIPYWDYSHDENFSGDIYLFYDDDHLNKTGRALFSETILERAFDEGYIK